ncbi:MAG: TonB family protein [Terriglobia bacterium]
MSPPLWFANFLAYCAQVALLVVVGTALPAMFRLRAPRVLLAYWQGLLGVCLLLPLLQPWRPSAVAPAAGGASVSISFAVMPAGAAISHAWVYPLIIGALMAGMLVRLAWLALGLGRLRAIRRAARAFDPLPEWMRELQSRLGFSPSWYLSAEIESPATFGVRPPSVLLPHRFPTLSEAFQRAIAGHELLHVARRDWIFNVAEELVLTTFWFHPAVAWVVNRIRLSREAAVDAEAVRLISARKPYMSALLEIASGGIGPALGAAPTFIKERQLAHRIELLVREVAMSKPRLYVSLTGIVGLLMLAGVLSIWAFPLRAPASAAAGSSAAANGNSEIPPVKQVPAVYPLAAKKAGIQGVVRLRVSISDDGSVSDIQVVSGDPQLAKAALDAVKQWRYPASDAGQVTTVSMNFTLSNNGPAAPGDQDSKPAQPATKTSLQPVAKVSPVYPPAAKKAGIQGLVLLRATVATDGSVSNLEVLSGDSQLASAALAAVKQWRYAPREKSVITDVTLNFTLAENGVSGGVTGGVIGGVKGGVTGGVSGGVTGGVYTVGNGVSAPVPIFKPEPPYTKEAKAAKIQGKVVLKIIIGVDGAVTDVKAEPGFDEGLTENAVNTVKTWKFKPAMKDGKPVPCKVSVEVSFKLY